MNHLLAKVAVDGRLAPPSEVDAALQPWMALAEASDYLLRRPDLALPAPAAGEIRIPSFLFIGPRGGGNQLRLGLFGAIHGDEKEGPGALWRFVRRLAEQPSLASGLALFFYPICNPTGFVDGTRHSRRGKDLNREFWKGSREPEIILLEGELQARQFQGLIALHADDTSDGMYGFVNGATLTRDLLVPALRAAAPILAPNRSAVIDGFAARDAMIHGGYPGMLAAPPGAAPAPFELVLESPQRAPRHLQERALAAALESIVTEYPRLLSFAQGL